MQRFRNHISLFKVFSVASLLGIYISASIFSNIHHYFHHDHQQEICTAEAEKDPCHIKVFHHNQTDGCKHETHVYTLENKCELCDAILAKFYFPDEESEILSFNVFFQSEPKFEAPFVFRFSNASIWLRGPPASLFSIV